MPRRATSAGESRLAPPHSQRRRDGVAALKNRLAGGENDNEPESVKRYRQFLAGACPRAPGARAPRCMPLTRAHAHRLHDAAGSAVGSHRRHRQLHTANQHQPAAVAKLAPGRWLRTYARPEVAGTRCAFSGTGSVRCAGACGASRPYDSDLKYCAQGSRRSSRSQRRLASPTMRPRGGTGSLAQPTASLLRRSLIACAPAFGTWAGLVWAFMPSLTVRRGLQGGKRTLIRAEPGAGGRGRRFDDGPVLAQLESSRR